MVQVIIQNKTLTIEDGVNDIVKVLKDNFQEAVDHRKNSGVDKRLIDALRQATSQYDPCVKQRFEAKKEPDVYFPLGAMKARAQTSWMKDTIKAAMEKMWEGEPTPIPELPKTVSDEIRQQVLAELQEPLQRGEVFNFQDLLTIVNGLVDEQVDREFQEAKDRSDRMSRLILDQWVEGSWLDTWNEISSDLGRSPIAIAKGPVEVQRRVAKWTASGGLTEELVVEPIMYRVSPANFYPTADVTHDVNSGTGIFELATMSSAQIYEAICTDNYNSEGLKKLLESNPSGFELTDNSSKEIRALLNRAGECEDFELGSGVFHTIKYYGRMKVETLRKNKGLTDIPKKLEDNQFVNIEAWVIKDTLAYLNIEPYPLGHRPFSVVPREFVAGSIWGGESLQSMIETPARVVNALIRQQILNMGYAAGPIGEAEAGRFPAGIPQYVEPRKMYQVNASVHGEKALRFTEITANTAAYITTINFYLNQADTLSGIPSFIEGEASGVRGLTNGQTEFSFGNASRGMDSLLTTIDRFLIESMLIRYYYRNLTVINDDSIKGDIKWKARGLSGVFNKQIRRNLSISAIQLLGQMREVMPSYVTEESFLKLVAPVFENIGLDIDEVLVKNQGDTTQPLISPAPELVDTINRVATESPINSSTT